MWPLMYDLAYLVQKNILPISKLFLLKTACLDIQLTEIRLHAAVLVAC